MGVLLAHVVAREHAVGAEQRAQVVEEGGGLRLRKARALSRGAHCGASPARRS